MLTQFNQITINNTKTHSKLFYQNMFHKQRQ